MKRYIFLSFIVFVCAFFVYLSWYFLGKAEESFTQISEAENRAIIFSPDEGKAKGEGLKKGPEVTEEASIKGSLVEKQAQEEKRQQEQTVPRVEEAVRKRISMDFENASLKDVLKAFCQQSGLNFVAGESVEMRPITLYLSNVEIKDALDAIIKANGLTYERAEGSNVFIVRKAVEPEIKLETKVYKLNYANLEDFTYVDPEGNSRTVKGIKEILQKLISPHGDFSIDGRTNTVIITDIPPRFPVIERALKKLDISLPQVVIEARIVQLGSTDEDKIGINWSGLGGVKIRLENPLRQYESTRIGGEERTDEYTINTSNGNTYEKEYHPTAGTSSDTESISISSTAGRVLTDTFSRILLKSDIRSAVLSADTFEAVLSFLLIRKNTDIISSPKIVTSHGRDAKIVVGELYPIPQYAYNTSTATWEVQGFEYRDIGVVLRVTPYVVAKDEGKISLRVHPEVSEIVKYVSFGGLAQMPVISTREAVTDVTINSGDTLAIGGLLKNRGEKNVTKVPVLGDIPLIGGLFRHKDNSVEKTNLIIFITPRILNTGEGTLRNKDTVRINLPETFRKPATPTPEGKTGEKPDGKKKGRVYNFVPRTSRGNDEG